MATKPEELASSGESGTASREPVRLRPALPGASPQPVASASSAVPARETDPYARLLDNYTHFSTLHQGEIREGRVVKISGEDVIVDIGYKSDGLVPLEQFRDPAGRIKVQPGDAIEVMLDHSGGDQEGYIRLSYERAHRLKLWERLEKAFVEKTPVTVQVLTPVNPFERD